MPQSLLLERASKFANAKQGLVAKSKGNWGGKEANRENRGGWGVSRKNGGKPRRNGGMQNVGLWLAYGLG